MIEAKRLRRIILGLLLTTAIFVIPGILALTFKHESLMVLVPMAVLSLIGAFVSLPILWFFEFKKYYKYKHYGWAGFLSGFIQVFLIFVLLSFKEGPNINFQAFQHSEVWGPALSSSLILGFFGYIYATIFWHIAIKERTV